MVEAVVLRGIGAIVSFGEVFLCIISLKALGNFKQDGDAERSKCTPSLKGYTIRTRGGIAAVSNRHFDVLASDTPSPGVRG